MMRSMLRLLVAVALGAAFAVPPAPAAADGYSLHAIGGVRTGWTDNLMSAESDPGATPPREADFYTQVMPGVLFTWDRPRIITELFYEAEANLYVEHAEAWSLSHRAGWRGFFHLTPLSELTTSIIGSGGTLNTFNTWGLAQDGEPVYLPSAESRYANVEGRTLYTRQLSRALRFSHTGTARVFTTLPAGPVMGSTGYLLGTGAGIDRSWRYNAVGLNATTSFAVLGAGTDLASQQLHGGVTASWRRDLSEEWNTVVDAGVAGALPLEAGDQLYWGPTAGAQIGYFPEWGSAGLSARRTIAPNLFLQASTVTDMAVANAWLPLPWLRQDVRVPRLTLGVSGGAGRTAIIDPASGDAFSGYGIRMLDVALAFQIREQMHVSARYQYVAQQIDDDAQALPNLRSYQRNTVLVAFYTRWPARVAGEVPIRPSLRVDRADAAPARQDGRTGDDEARR
jgi:hypothetical protein